MKECMQERPIKTLVFDFMGVLFFIDKARALNKIGVYALIMYYLRHRTDPFKDSFSLLNKMRLEAPGEFQDVVAYRGTYLPMCMLEWQRGKLDSKAALQRLLSFFGVLAKKNYFKDELQRKTLLRFAQLLLNAGDMFRPVAHIECLIRSLKKDNHYRLYILSNIDRETFEAQKILYKNFFSLFDGIVTSYETQLLKPDPTIYQYLIDTYNLTPSDCCYIDDQNENLVTAQQFGMMTILCKKASKLAYLLRYYGIIK
jgi:HAD superfamily hydrolase (TIGR01549 family)